MSRSVDLPDSVYAALEAAATSSGTTPAGWIAARLPQPAPADQPECEEEQQPRTLADAWAGYIGLFSSDCGDLSERVSEIYGEAVMEKHRARQRSAPRETASDTSVHLPASTFAVLEKAASASGTTPAGWIASNLPSVSAVEPESEGPPSDTLAERFAGLIGGFRSEHGDLAERHSELFMEGLLEKRRLGNL